MAKRGAPKGTKGGTVRLQVVIKVGHVERIDKLAERMGMTRSYFTATLIEQALLDQEWLVKLLSSKLVMRVARALGINNPKKAKQMEKEYQQALRDVVEDES